MKLHAPGALIVAFVLLTISTTSQERGTATPGLLRSSFGKLPLYFIENRGVYPEEVKFYVQGADKTLFFTKKGITFRL